VWLKLVRVAAGLCLLALTACAPGMVLGEANCLGSTELITQVSGQCTRTFDDLKETENDSIAIQTSDVSPFVTVDWEAQVETGRVAITFTDFHGNEHTTEVTPRSPGSGTVRVQLDPLNRIRFTLTPLDGPATGVKYELNFVCDCLP
jgi:hypothetical protein